KKNCGRMPMFVSTHTIRRGTSALPLASSGRIASSSGRAIATPAPRRNVRRDNGRGACGREFGISSGGKGRKAGGGQVVLGSHVPATESTPWKFLRSRKRLQRAGR